jgi:hypothetical protein
MARRRVVKRAMTRAKATEVRRRVESAQRAVRADLSTTDAAMRGRARETLDRFGVTAYENVTQSRHRVMRFWRVYADPS